MDEAISALWKAPGLRAVCVVATEAARHARDVHHALEASAALLAQGLTAAQLLSSLKAGKFAPRVNLQLECDGPLRGLYADADGAGGVRGYIKNPLVDIVSSDPQLRWRPALGNAGFLSVLRDLGEGEHFRSSVELVSFDLSSDLTHFFELSEQLPTRVGLSVVGEKDEPLGKVAGLVVQALPDADLRALTDVGERLSGGALAQALVRFESATDVLRAVLPDAVETSRGAVAYRCTCSQERVLQAFAAMGRAEIEKILAEEGKSEATCQFCGKKYQATQAELKALLASN